ncbi:MAG: hypothetical protein NC120_09795 [Ruminococcus sp.]|nr:hypothetical protein [Ruminococcus sp.]
MSFIAGYLMGLEDNGGKSAVLKQLNAEENGIYVPQLGTDGFSKVCVNVPDRYEEGYGDGYREGLGGSGAGSEGRFENDDFIICHHDVAVKPTGVYYAYVEAVAIPKKVLRSYISNSFEVQFYLYKKSESERYFDYMKEYVGYEVSDIIISKGEETTTVTVKVGITGVYPMFGTMTSYGDIELIFSNRVYGY